MKKPTKYINKIVSLLLALTLIVTTSTFAIADTDSLNPSASSTSLYSENEANIEKTTPTLGELKDQLDVAIDEYYTAPYLNLLVHYSVDSIFYDLQQEGFLLSNSANDIQQQAFNIPLLGILHINFMCTVEGDIYGIVNANESGTNVTIPSFFWAGIGTLHSYHPNFLMFMNKKTVLASTGIILNYQGDFEPNQFPLFNLSGVEFNGTADLVFALGPKV